MVNNKIEPSKHFQVFPYAGLYHAVIPSAECEGLFSLLRLSADYTYVLRVKKLGVSDSFLIEKGTFQWNPSKNLLTLSGKGPGSNKFLFEKGNFVLLDPSGRRPEGDEAERASFIFYPFPMVMKEIRWKLVEINGKPLPSEESYRQPPYIFFPVHENAVYGFDGCNAFRGQAKVNEKSIEISDIVSTKVYCAQVTIDKSFIQNLQDSKSYSGNDTELTFLKDGKPTLRFVAVY
ncbi:MAG: META domain-containing protein [Flavobacteriales bacterium]|nr:META domain-containing protein [Flavobacteriales bacterium]